MIQRIISLALVITAAPAMAALEVDVTEGVTNPIPIAIAPFGGDEGGVVDVSKVIEQDLASTGQFDILPREQMLEKPVGSDGVKYENWRSVKVDDLVVGNMRPSGDGYSVRFEILDVYKGGKLAGYEITSRGGKAMRYTAHKIADLIYTKLTGLPGIFTTRIAYVTTTGKGWHTKFDLVVADQDGYNPQVKVSSDDVIMSPAWSPDGRRLAFASIRDGKSEIYVYELADGTRRRISQQKGINGSPAWSPDGRSLAVTLSFTGSPDIYVIDVSSGERRRVTDSRSIDTEPTWAPDGRSLVFTSDRGGKPQLYRVSASGGEAKRITFDGKSNQAACYSPDGKYIAMVHEDENGYRIAVMEPDGGSVRSLTSGPLDENPSFAPNGQVVIYGKPAGNVSELATISVDGRVKRRLRQSNTVRDPAWSPAEK